VVNRAVEDAVHAQDAGCLVEFVLDLRALRNLDERGKPFRQVIGERHVVPGMRAHAKSPCRLGHCTGLSVVSSQWSVAKKIAARHRNALAAMLVTTDNGLWTTAACRRAGRCRWRAAACRPGATGLAPPRSERADRRRS